jgi:short subunit dehydrogenase-like uncharacterized protein
VADQRAFDVVLLGATGFTGELTAQKLLDAVRDDGVRVAIAGRDGAKLAAVKERLAAHDPAAEKLDTITADVGDPSSLVAMTRRTRVLATTVGPYARLGEPVVEACVKAATHYADLTGEPQFVRAIRDRFHDAAERAGVRIVNSCGFDSIPHDLGALLAVRQLPADAPIELRGYVAANGRASGGTIASALNAFADVRGALQGSRGSGRRSDARKARSLPLRVHRARDLGAWGVPLPTIDPQVVLRSARTLGDYGPDFRYGHFAQVPNLPLVVGGATVVGGAVLLAQTGPTRRLLTRLAPEPGTGPDERTRARSWFRVTMLGRGGGKKVRVQVSGGDPGYGETSRMLAESAVSLAVDDLPERYGVITTAVAFEERLIERLRTHGIAFDVLEVA